MTRANLSEIISCAISSTTRGPPSFFYFDKSNPAVFCAARVITVAGNGALIADTAGCQAGTSGGQTRRNGRDDGCSAFLRQLNIVIKCAHGVCVTDNEQAQGGIGPEQLHYFIKRRLGLILERCRVEVEVKAVKIDAALFSYFRGHLLGLHDDHFLVHGRGFNDVESDNGCAFGRGKVFVAADIAVFEVDGVECEVSVALLCRDEMTAEIAVIEGLTWAVVKEVRKRVTVAVAELASLPSQRVSQPWAWSSLL